MKVNAKQFNRILSLLGKIVKERGIREALRAVKLTWESEELIITGTDLEIAIEFRIPATGGWIAPTVVNLEALARAASAADDEVGFIIRDDGAALGVQADGIDIDIPLAPDILSEFPVIEWPGEIIAEVYTFDLLEALKRNIFCVAKGDTRYALNGILFAKVGRDFETVSSDTHRLSRCRFVNSSPEGEDRQSIVYFKQVILDALKGVEGVATVKLQTEGPGLAVIEAPGVKILSRLIEGQYPTYEKFIPDQAQASLGARIEVGNRKALLEAVRKAGKFACPDTNAVLFGRSSPGILIRACNEASPAVVQVPSSDSCRMRSAAHNWHYLAELLALIPQESFSIHLDELALLFF